MGRFKPEDKTALVMPVTALITGLVAISGGITVLVLGSQAEERSEHGGEVAFANGSAAILGGLATVTGAITTICMKIRDVRARDDGDHDDTEDRSLQQADEALASMQGQFNEETRLLPQTGSSPVPTDQLV